MAPLLTQSLCLIQNSFTKSCQNVCRMQAVKADDYGGYYRRTDDTDLEAVKYTVDAAFIFEW